MTSPNPGRTTVGRRAHHRQEPSRIHHRPHLFRENRGTARGSGPARSADRLLRLARRERGLAPARPDRARRGSYRHQHQVRPRGDLRGDLPDRGLLRHHVALVPRSPLRAAEELGGRVQGPRRHVRGAAVRHRRVHEQRDRRDQEPDRLHGRLPADDRQGHLRHQRHRARRRVAARPQPGCLLRAEHRQDLRQGHLHLQDDPVARCVAGVRDRQARHGRRPPRPQAQAERHRAAEGARLGRRQDPRGVRRVRVHAAHAGEGSHHHHRRGAARHLPQAAAGRAADPRGRPGAAGELLLQPEAVRPGQGRSLQDQQEARAGAAVRQAGPDDRGHRRRDPLHRRAARGSGDAARPARRADRRRGRHRPLRQPPAAYRGGADPEPAAHRPRPDGARRPGSDDDPGRRGDHAADLDQHPSGGGGAEGVLRHLAAVPVHGPDQPGRRPDPQAAAVGPGSGRSVPRPRGDGGS